MGFLHEPVGHMTVEARRESFVIHPRYGYDEEGNEFSDIVLVDGVPRRREAFATRWRQEAHPEFLYDDLDDLIAALKALRAERVGYAERLEHPQPE